MFYENRIWFANTEDGTPVGLLPQMANRHGLVAGATGTGKTVTLKILAETFSEMGVPVFMADVKGDIAGIMAPGEDSEDMQKRIERFGLADKNFSYQGYPVTFWDIYGEKGIQLRTTISEMGPLLLARILDLNELQSDILSIVFKIADDNDLLLIDTKDLKAMLNYVSANNKEFATLYGKMSPVSIAAILRAVVALEVAGGDKFFGEPAVNVKDWFTQGSEGKGMITVLDSESLINNGRLYSTFLLWMLSELFETLPEVGDLDKPKMVFFFDEAHLLFKGAPAALLDKIEQVVKLIRSKGVGVYFCTQNPRDIPDSVLAQLGNKIQHGLRAYTPSDQKAVKAAAQSFRENPAFDTYEAILNLGTAEAVVSVLDEDGIPTIAEKAYILPPKSRMGSIDESERRNAVQGSILYSKYAEPHDPDSAYEFLERKGLEEAAAAEKAREEAEAEKQRLKEEAAAEKARAKEEAAAERQKKRTAKTIGNSVVGTVGREVGKQVGGKFGRFGKLLGGNLGASLGRGILSTLFKL
ncbi:MAG: DUF853 family protein [Lachnospiraceae bacterium]|nr:DUF853 family protein [Lachnospiraceae bacterium]MBQ9643940.1 DUF853 family protein [Lachnospiraceae bacterium]